MPSSARFVVFAILLLDCLSTARLHAALWTHDVVTGASNSAHLSLLVDRADNPLVSYYDEATRTLKLARHDGAVWTIKEVDPGPTVGRHSSSALDAADNPAICYYDELNQTLKVARHNGVAWNVDTVAAAEERVYCSIAFDSADYPAITYGDPDSRLQLARFDGSIWVIEEIDATSELFGSTSVAFDAADEPSVAYATTSGMLKHARFDGLRWTTDVLAAGHSPDLAYAPDGNPAIAFITSGPKDSLFVARYNGAAWTSELVMDSATVITDLDLDIDAEGYLAISSQHRTSAVLIHRNNAGPWQQEDISSSLPDHHSLAFDSAGQPLVAYYPRISAEIKVARVLGACCDGVGGCTLGPSTACANAGGAFQGYGTVCSRSLPVAASVWRRVEVERMHWSGEMSDVVLNLGDNPAVARWTFKTGELRLVRWDGTRWISELVDVRPSIARVSMSLDPLGHLAIAYIDSTDWDLVLARHDGLSWTIEVVDGLTSMVGRDCSLAFDADGRPAISYTDATVPAMKLARHDGTVWTVDTVDSIGLWGSSLAFDQIGNPAVSYFATTGEIRLARHNGATWNRDTVGPVGNIASATTSLAFDLSDLPAVAYRDGRTGDRWFARHDGTLWNRDVIDAGTSSGTPSLAFDPSGNPVISYIDNDDGLIFATHDGIQWHRDTVDVIGTMSSVTFDGNGTTFMTYHAGSHLRFARLESCTLPGCSAPLLAPVEQLLAVTSHNRADVLLSWSDDAEAGDGHSVYYVADDKSMIPACDGCNPGFDVVVPGCNPTGTFQSSCVHAGAAKRNAGTVYYYNVVGMCGGTKGPS